jgi:hypothetical protein
MASTSGLLGAAVQIAFSSSSGGFDSIVTIVGASNPEFDGQLAVSRMDAVASFDAKLCVEIAATKVSPSAQIVTPTLVNSSGLPSFLVQFSGIGTASGQRTITQYTWYFPEIGQIYVSGSNVTSHSFASSGSYLVVLRVTDSDGLVGFDSRRIVTHSGVVLSLPSLQISGATTGGSAPLSVNFGASGGAIGGGTIYGYEWSFSNGLFSKRQNPSGIVYNTPGHYLPVCSIWDNRGVIVSDSITVGINN